MLPSILYYKNIDMLIIDIIYDFGHVLYIMLYSYLCIRVLYTLLHFGLIIFGQNYEVKFFKEKLKINKDKNQEPGPLTRAGRFTPCTYFYVH